MQAEWADLAEAPAQNKRLSLFAISVPLAILSPFAAGVSFLAFALMAAAFLFVAIVCRSVRLGAGIYYVGLPILALLFLREQPDGLLFALWALGTVWATDIGAYFAGRRFGGPRSEAHTSELQSLMRHSYAVFCLKKKQNTNTQQS